MSDLEIAAAVALSRLKYYPDSIEEKFVKAMLNRAKKEWGYKLSFRQREFLWELVIKHRRKISDVALTEKAETEILGHHQASLF